MTIIEKTIRKLKKDDSYTFNHEISFIEISSIIFERIIQALRGIFYSFFTLKPMLFFKGTNVKIKHKLKLKIGFASIIEDNVYINSFSQKGVILHNNVTIGRNSILIGSGVIKNKGVGIEIKENSAIGAYSILAGQGGINIGKDVIMGPDVKIFSENHNYNLNHIPIRLQGESRIGVIINDNCWIGAGTIILDGVILAEGTVVAAGSVVTKPFIEKNCLIAGTPAKKLKNRLANHIL